MTTRRLSTTQLQILLDAWDRRIYQRRFQGKTYSWNTRTDKLCTQQTSRLYPDLLTLVDLPKVYGLDSRRFVPTPEGEEYLIKRGMIEQP